ncbi:MAG: hypothetical protein AAF493_02085 [Pseudomonadota bacterium]
MLFFRLAAGLVLWTLSQTAILACEQRPPTPPAWLGPHDFSIEQSATKLWRPEDGGEPLFLRLRVVDTCGEPVPGVEVRILHANQFGEHEAGRWRTRLNSDARGELKLLTVFPGYAGGLPRHIHFILAHPDFDELITRLFFKNDPEAGADVGELALVLEEIERPIEGGKTGRGWVAGFEFVLKGR